MFVKKHAYRCRRRACALAGYTADAPAGFFVANGDSFGRACLRSLSLTRGGRAAAKPSGFLQRQRANVGTSY